MSKFEFVKSLSDDEVWEVRETWNPDGQYDDWPEPNKSVMKNIAQTFYDMSLDEFRKYLEEQSDG